MRRFEIIDADDNKRGEGIVFSTGECVTREWLGADRYSDAWNSLASVEKYLQHNGYSCRFLDHSPSDQKPEAAAGKMPSERWDELHDEEKLRWSREARSTSYPDILRWIALERLLDERLGRGGGT